MAPMKLIFLALYLHNFSLKGHDFAFEDTTCQNGHVISPSLLRMKLNEAGLLVNETGSDFIITSHRLEDRYTGQKIKGNHSLLR